jgi:hypothetical protein
MLSVGVYPDPVGESVGLLTLIFSLFHPRPPTPFNSPYDRSTLLFYHSLQNT